MLYTKTVKPVTLELLKSLMQKEYLQQFVLVGGTALALQLGHRKSIDLDLLTTENFNSDLLISPLQNDFDLFVNQKLPQTILCIINDVKVDFIRFHYPYIRPVLKTQNIRMLSIEDIAPMLSLSVKNRPHKQHIWFLPTQNPTLKNQKSCFCQRSDEMN